MCGIVGFLKNDDSAAPEAMVSKMLEKILHRGPDAHNLYARDNIALGHSRLAILDTSTGANQPFKSEDERYTLVYNGEIYNFREIRNQITEVTFTTDSDTEVLLQAFIKWGKDCLYKFNGMFAFAIWDNHKKELFIARDRLGIKPFYYVQNKEGFIFGSEIRALLASGLVAKELDTERVCQYLQYQSVLDHGSLIKGIQQLPSGHYATVSAGDLVIASYWDPKVEHVEAIEDRDIIHKNIRNILRDAVELRMVSDVPLGAFLSGGIDSSAIVGLISEVTTDRVNTFSIGFEEKKYDESEYARMIAKRFNTKHHQLFLKPTSLLDHLEEALSAMDTPSGDGVNSYLISKETKAKGLTVALSGLGGDELFSGYPVFSQVHKLLTDHPVWSVPEFIRRMGAGVLQWYNYDSKTSRMAELLQAQKDFSSVYPIFRKIYSNQEIEKLGLSVADYDNPQTALLTSIDEKLPILSKVSIAEILTYTQPVLLKDVDQMSMAHALEVRVPFFDHLLYEYVIQISDHYKYPNYPKQLLVESLKDLLPDEIVHRKKKGFAFPWELWMRKELKDFCKAQIDYLKTDKVFEADYLDTLWNDFLAKKPAVTWTKVWLLVVLGYWMKKNLADL